MGKRFKGYKSARLALAAAEKRGLTGVTGSGQTAVVITSPAVDGYAFKTWDNQIVLPGKIISKKALHKREDEIERERAKRVWSNMNAKKKKKNKR